MKIERADIKHAAQIGRAITIAIGDDITKELAGTEHTPEDVVELFARLGARIDTQYSYRNTWVAVDDDGTVMGLAICYDGALLVPLRRVFFAEARDAIGLVVEGDVDALPGETSDDEVYLDTLCVFPRYRRRGVATALIEAVKGFADGIGKPLGLLVDKKNGRARKLYEKVGFRFVDERPFAGEMMDHLSMD